MDVFLLRVLCVVSASVGVLSSVVFLSMKANPGKGRPWPGIGSKRHRRK